MSAHAASTFSMQADAFAGAFVRVGVAVLRVDFIPSQLSQFSKKGKPESTLESHFESIRN
jgi:hypothetical protein